MADDIVTVLVRDVQGVEIVARLDLGDDLAEDFERSGADMLICAIDEHEMSRRWNAALRKHPPLAILNLGRDAARGRLLALRPEQRAIDDLTAESLLAILQARMRAALGAHEP